MRVYYHWSDTYVSLSNFQVLNLLFLVFGTRIFSPRRAPPPHHSGPPPPRSPRSPAPSSRWSWCWSGGRGTPLSRGQSSRWTQARAGSSCRRSRSWCSSPCRVGDPPPTPGLSSGPRAWWCPGSRASPPPWCLWGCPRDLRCLRCCLHCLASHSPGSREESLSRCRQVRRSRSLSCPEAGGWEGPGQPLRWSTRLTWPLKGSWCPWSVLCPWQSSWRLLLALLRSSSCSFLRP